LKNSLAADKWSLLISTGGVPTESKVVVVKN